MKNKTHLSAALVAAIALINISIGLISCGKNSNGGTVPPATNKQSAKVPLVSLDITNIYDGTTAPAVVTHDSISCGADVSSDNGATVTERGICYGTSQNPTVVDGHVSDGSGTGHFSTGIDGLTVNTAYYIRAYATNSAGTGYSAQVKLTTAYILGEYFEGGSIFYVDSTNLHGLIAAVSPRTGTAWPSGFTGATSFFDGATNTDEIVQAFGAGSQNPASLCRACTDGGYTDWFLPALVQLEQLGASPLGDIDWSSTQDGGGGFYVLASPYQNNYVELGGVSHPCRPVRAF